MRFSAGRLLLLFAVVLSLSSLPGALSTHFTLPAIPTVRANIAPLENWNPAGPAMDAQVITIFQDQNVELAALQQATPSIDLSDWRLTPAQISSLTSNPNFFVTPQITEHAYYEIDFHQANNFWGINFSFGNDPNGLQIRQGIAHLINKEMFVANEPDLAGAAVAIDSPVPAGSSFGGDTFQAPNPCDWDTLYRESGPRCILGAPGGTAYNCSVGAVCPTGTLGIAPPHPEWGMAQIGSADFCAAANHIMNALNNGVLASSRGAHLNGNCELLAPGQVTLGVGWPANVTSSQPNFFPRFDDPPRLALGNSISQEICALWTGGYTTGCSPFLSVTTGTITSFCGFFTSTSGISDCWWMYPGAFEAFPIDASVYFGYNSQFVSGGAWDHPACASNTQSPDANNFEYVCNSAYDAASSQVEFASSPSAAFSAATNAMDIFGRNVLTLPFFTTKDQNAYLHNWSRVINGDGAGIANQFTWLNARTSTPATGATGCPNVAPFSNGLCIRQGFKQPTRSLSWYIASTLWDQHVLGDVYDSLGVLNPSNNGQLLDWMTIRSQELTQQSLLPYSPPSGTTDTFRFTLRPDLFWQDGTRVTSWDVQFSFASLLASGAYFGSGLAPLLPPSGSCNNSPPASNGNCADQITVLSPTQFDVSVYQHGPFTLLGLMTTPILPGRYWSAPGSTAWSTCVTAASCPISAMSADPTKLGFTYDPINAGIFIGSGAWECVSNGVSSPAGTLGTGCSSTGLQNPPPGGSYTLTRNGFGFAPGSSPPNEYFRSSGTLALYLWSGNTGDPVGDPLNFSRLALCVGQPTVPLGQTSGCGHWQQGMGSNGGPAIIGGVQASIVLRFFLLDWVTPFNMSIPPDNMIAFNPVLHEGPATLSPASRVGCSQPFPTGGYDC